MDTYAYLEDLWNYLYMEHPLEPADAIIGFGSHDQTIASRAAQLYKAGWASRILFTGYLGKGTLGVFPKPEAELFAEIAIKEGVPPEAILIEDKATNTGENIHFAKRMFESKGMVPQKIIAVHKPYMTRRVWAALQKQWPELEVIIAPGNPSLKDYVAGMLADGVEEGEIIDSLVGDFQRMDAFARLGYQIPQEIPPRALASYEALIKLGYDKYVV
ncbi:MAG: YdcF family protein [Candidatus Limiplasma sp.]|nr:YdcF family protein [Candidatus Limiplasma sp.]